MKIALLFPGQGSQYVGMGRELYDNSPAAKAIIDAIPQELKTIIFEGPEETLKITKYTQPAIFTVSMAAYEALKEALNSANIKLEIIASAGHSLGEYSALCAAGFFDFKTGLDLVSARGQYIQQASEANPGTMAAILGLENNIVEDICKTASAVGVCEAVNFNSPGQIVIAGTNEAVAKAMELATQAKATKVVPLSVSGPFHSSLMNPAADMMKERLATAELSVPEFGVVTNCDATMTKDASVIKDKLVSQIKSSVKWEQSIKTLADSGAELFIEIGPGRVLSGLMRRIDKTKKVINIEDKASLEKAVQELGVI
ncbi:MAG: ACP S-malonyltransferase [Elusimicrobia bacterium]|nr:ACP S-malonyltransferase [Elusimicrobiota bacterium]